MNLDQLLDELVLAIRTGVDTTELLEYYDTLKKGYRIVGDYAEIPLSRGYWSKVDVSQLEKILIRKWYVIPSKENDSIRLDVKAKFSGKHVSLARYLLGLEEGNPKIADHINGDTLDNRLSNLRPVELHHSMQNRTGWRKTKDGSRFKGVHAQGKKWVAIIKANNKTHYLGTFSTQEEAALAYNNAALNLHGPYARLNYVE